MNKNNLNLIIIFLFFIGFLVFYKFSIGSMLVDFSRESYIPFQMLSGKVLFKDIFTIYGIFGYIVNFLLYKIYVNFNLLLLLSLFISILFSYIFYFICLKFLKDRKISLLFTLGFISLSIFSNTTFSFILPYSYSTLWAVFGIYCILISILYNKPSFVFLSLGLVFANKIEYFIPAFLICLFYFIVKKENIYKKCIYITVFPMVNIIYLITNNIKLADILNNNSYIAKMVKTESISYLYKLLGTFFEFHSFIINLCIITFLSLMVFLISKYKKFSIIGTIILLVSIILINPNKTLNLVIVPIFIYTILNYKKFDINEIILFLLAGTLSIKSIFRTGTHSYSNFGFFLLILFLYIILIKVFDNKKKIPLILLIWYIISSNIFNLYYYFDDPKYQLKTDSGTLYLRDYEKALYIQLSDFLDKNLKKSDTFTIVPEGQIFNLIAKRQHNHYNSTFTPLDFETFGEEFLINKFKENPPKYVVFFPRNTSDYGKPVICYNYGIDFCTYIMDNYERKAILDAKYKALIFEKKE